MIPLPLGMRAGCWARWARAAAAALRFWTTGGRLPPVRLMLPLPARSSSPLLAPPSYINGKPFVVREAERPFSNLEYTGGGVVFAEFPEQALLQGAVAGWLRRGALCRRKAPGPRAVAEAPAPACLLRCPRLLLQASTGSGWRAWRHG